MSAANRFCAFEGDTMYHYEQLNGRDSIKSNELVLELQLSIEKYLVHDNYNLSFNWPNAAYALSCVEHYMAARNTITDIQIITVSDFNDTYHSGDTMTEAFVLFGQDYNPTEIIKTPVSGAIDKLNYQLFEHATYYGILLHLNEEVQNSNQVQFEIIVHLENGKILSATSEKIMIY